VFRLRQDRELEGETASSSGKAICQHRKKQGGKKAPSLTEARGAELVHSKGLCKEDNRVWECAGGTAGARGERRSRVPCWEAINRLGKGLARVPGTTVAAATLNEKEGKNGQRSEVGTGLGDSTSQRKLQ